MDKQQKNTNNVSSKAMLPYEKFMREGAEKLSDAELLAILLRTGTKGEDTVSIGQKILTLSAGKEQGLLGLYHLSVEELMSLKGVGQVKAVRIKCVTELSKRLARLKSMKKMQFTNPECVAQYYMESLRHAEHEQTILILMDGKNHLIRELVLTKGTVNASLLSPREIFVEALRSQAVYIMLVHNHPSGDASPSRQDIQITRQIQDCGRLIGIPLIDHIIIGDMTFVSMKQRGFLD